MAEKFPPLLLDALRQGSVIPYLGAGLLDAAENTVRLPATPEALAELLTTKVSVPHKIRKRLTAAAQYIENFKHRKTLVNLMNGVFSQHGTPTALHQWLSTWPDLPLLVSAWYDDTMQRALVGRTGGWGMVQGLSQSEHFGQWIGYYHADGSSATEAESADWQTLLYQPWGSASPAGNYLVSDSDYVEVLTEIDIQTPIPEPVQRLRAGRHFLFLGCRFNDQLSRSFARQIMKRSSDQHWAILPTDMSRNEQRFLLEQRITPLHLSLEEVLDQLPAAEIATESFIAESVI